MSLKNKINEHAEQKQKHRYREHFDGCQTGEGLRRWMKKVKGLRSTIACYRIVMGMYTSIGNRVKNIAVSVCDDTWVLDSLE